MLLRALRQRGSLKKLGKHLLRPVLYGFLVFIGSLIVWKFILGTLHATGLMATRPGLRLQYLIPLAIAVATIAYRLYRDLGPASQRPS
jgi:hypothetical protein